MKLNIKYMALPMQVLMAVALLIAGAASQAADYKIDTSGAHASINFKIPHLGYSILVGRFDEFNGTFSYDPNKPADTKVDVTIKTTSLNSNHTERDKHLKSGDFLEVDKFPEAHFVSTGFEGNGMEGTLTGNLTLHGVTKTIDIAVAKVGEGKDPWGGYRAGFMGSTTLTLKNFAIKMDLGPASQQVELELFIEGVRQ